MTPMTDKYEKKKEVRADFEPIVYFKLFVC